MITKKGCEKNVEKNLINNVVAVIDMYVKDVKEARDVMELVWERIINYFMKSVKKH